MATLRRFNLFVYGTLMNPWVFRAVTGRRLVHTRTDADGVINFFAENAILEDYKKVSFDNTYQYALPDLNGRIRGYLIGSLPGELMAALREYEGKNYSKRTVRVWVFPPQQQSAPSHEGPDVANPRGRRTLPKAKAVKAIAFVGNLRQLQHSFGYAFNDPLKQEIILSEKIEKALIEAESQQLHSTEDTLRRAVAELRGATIRDIVRKHFEVGGISDYAIRHSLKDAPLPDFSRIQNDPEAKALAGNYLTMVIRQVIFNQTEERLRHEFRYELDHMSKPVEHYERTISSLATLRMLNDSSAMINKLVQQCLSELSFEKHHLVDFVKWAVLAAGHVYDSSRAKQGLNYIETHSSQGYVSLGAELEFSNIGHSVIRDPQGRVVGDRSYDGFIYFSDFGLDMRTWKLGGHIDDHHERASNKPRRGFFEVAMGILSIEEDISKPVTDSPWILNELIHQVSRFYDVAPHSVHVSLQLRTRRRPSHDRLMPLGIMKCLFAVAGGPARDSEGRLKINRLTGDEIITLEPVPHMLFSEISLRHSGSDDDIGPVARALHAGGRYVQQFRFLRLSSQLNYEPIIMALKGLQISLRPGTFLTAEQYQASPKHKRLFEQLVAWGQKPEPIPARSVELFLNKVYDGLMTERRGKPAHNEAYIMWSINQLRSMLKAFNDLARTG